MSRSEKNTINQNPATRFFDFAGGTGQVEFYDRESKTNIPVEFPFKFLVLDEVMTVGGGYDDGDKFIGYYSTAIRSQNAKIEPITVWQSSGKKQRVAMKGLWSEIKAGLTGAKYIKGLYIMWFNDETNQMEIGYLKIRGAALMPWVNFNADRKDVCVGAFAIVGNAPKKKGTNHYFEPVFEWTETIKPESEAKALELDSQVLQPYLRDYFAKQGTYVETPETEDKPDIDLDDALDPKRSSEAFMPQERPYDERDDIPPSDDIGTYVPADDEVGIEF